MSKEIDTTEATVQQAELILGFDASLVAAKSKDLMNKLAPTSAGVFMIQIEDIHVLDDFNVRIKTPELEAHISDLANSMLANGFMPSETLAGYGATLKGKSILYVTDGHNRLAAAKLANKRGASIDALPVAISGKAVSMEDLTVALMTTASGKSLTPLEQSFVCKRLSAFGWDAKKIAHHVSKSPQYIERLLAIAGSPLAIRDMIGKGEVPMHVAEKVLRESGSDAVAVLQESVQKAKSSGKSKVTMAALGSKALPKKLVSQVETSVMIVFADMESLLPEQFNALSEEKEPDDEGATIAMPVGALRQLKAAYEAVKAYRAA